MEILKTDGSATDRERDSSSKATENVLTCLRDHVLLNVSELYFKSIPYLESLGIHFPHFFLRTHERIPHTPRGNTIDPCAKSMMRVHNRSWRCEQHYPPPPLRELETNPASPLPFPPHSSSLIPHISPQRLKVSEKVLHLDDFAKSPCRVREQTDSYVGKHMNEM